VKFFQRLGQQPFSEQQVCKPDTHRRASWGQRAGRSQRRFGRGSISSGFLYRGCDQPQVIVIWRQTDGLTIEFGDLGANGVVEVYCRKATAVTRNGTKLREGADYKYDAQAQKLTISFEGSTKIVLKGAASLF